MKILLLRSGRHLHAAVESLRRAFPGCCVSVVGQPGTEAGLEQLGIPEEDRFIYRERKAFSPFSFAASRTGRSLFRRRFKEVAVLWADPEGAGYSNVNNTALLFSPKGFIAITPDGSLLRQNTWTIAGRETRRALWSLGVLAALNLFLYFPAALLRLFKR
jgi:hypothetical protein